jgi:monovalent cation:H+ antiporter-2, CPA2 family
MHDVTFLQDMAIVMAVSAVATVICHQLRLPVVLGYILAGVVIGPHTPPYALITDLKSIQTLSELGVIFLLFGIGLEFSLTKLMKVGAVSFAAAMLEIFLMLWIGFALGKIFGWSFMNSLFLGAILSISSTTIIGKILLDSKKLNEKFGQIILGILVIEDILAIVIIAVLSGLASTGEFTFTSAFNDLLRVGGFIAAILFVGALFLPRALAYLYTFQSSEMMIVAVLGLCFGTSLVAAKMGFSVALGAFLIGAVMAETRQAKFIIRHMESIRDMFTAVFFVAIGMLLVPATIVQYAVPIAIITVVTIIGKVFSCAFAAFLTGSNPTTALRVGLGLAQIGEFSFIIAQMGETSGATSSFIFPIAVAVSCITTLSTPFLMKYADPITRSVARLMPKPVVTFAGLYTEWMERIHEAKAGQSRRPILIKNLKIFLPWIVFYICALFILFTSMPKLSQFLSMPDALTQMIGAIMMFPFLVGLLYTLDKLLWQTFLFPFLHQKEGEAHGALHNVMRFVMIVVVSLVMLTLTPIFMPFIPVGFIVLGIVGVAAMIVWGSMRKIHERIEGTIMGLLDQEPAAKPQINVTHDELVRMIQKDYPWGVETQDVMLPFVESAINKPLKDVSLRAHTGATIVAIYRDEKAIINPTPDTVLAPGDVLLLMGSKEQLATAVKFIHDKIKKG